MYASPFHEPFWTSLPAGGGSSSGYPIAINGIGYGLDLTAQPQRSSVNVVQDRKDATSAEALLLPTEVWRRIRDSWHQGDAQTMGDREESLPYRFSSSVGVNVWEKWQCSLLAQTQQKVGASAGAPWCGVVNGWLCVVEGVNLRWYQTEASTAVSFTLTATAVSVTSSGSKVFIACSDGVVYQALPGLAASSFATLANVSWVGYVKDFLLAAANNVLSNITSGTPVTIRTHPQSTFRWVDGCEGLSCIYLIGGTGDRYVIHRLSIDETATVVNPPIVAAMLPDGEVGYAVGSYMGYAFIGTDKGLRFGVPAASGDLTLGPLIETDYPVRCFEGQGRFVWFGLTNFTPTLTGLGRVDLTTFTEPLAPAAASDLYVESGGAVTSITTWNGKTVFGVANLGVYVETATRVASGYLIESDLTFGVPDRKNAHYAMLRTKPMQGAVTLDFSYDGGSYRTVAGISEQGLLESGNAYLNGAQFGKLQARLQLFRSEDDPTVGPEVTRWEVRAEPVTGKGSQWQIPVLITSQLEVNGASKPRNPDEDRETLIGLVADGTVVTYREGRLSWQVHLLDYIWKPTGQNREGSFEGVLTLLAREVK